MKIIKIIIIKNIIKKDRCKKFGEEKKVMI